ncbi:MAG: ABC transporter ATP-binding protein [Actinomycetota bacterium]
MSIIEVEDLSKVYGSNRAVDGLSFCVEPGEIYALLGENGAGKTTTVEILEGHRSRSSGRVSVLGSDPSDAGREFRDRIGIVLQQAGVESEFTVRELLTLYGASFRNRHDVDELIEMVELPDKADDRVGSLSGGQKRRVDLAIGLVGRPDLLFLDEPTTGFDPQARRRSWDLISGLREHGTTVVLTTHYLDEAEHLADRVGVMAGGKMIAEGTPAELVDRMSGTIITFDLPEGIDDPSTVFGPLLGAEIRLAGTRVDAAVESPTAAVHRLTGWAVERSIELTSLTLQRASLEDVYLELNSAEGADEAERP